MKFKTPETKTFVASLVKQIHQQINILKENALTNTKEDHPLIASKSLQDVSNLKKLADAILPYKTRISYKELEKYIVEVIKEHRGISGGHLLNVLENKLEYKLGAGDYALYKNTKNLKWRTAVFTVLGKLKRKSHIQYNNNSKLWSLTVKGRKTL